MRKHILTLSAILTLLHLSISLYSQLSFPLHVSENKRYLVDANGDAFFYQADTPWHLFLNLHSSEAEQYIMTRKEQGFTSLQIMLTGAKGQLDLNGESPWLGDHDFSRPNEKYFARVDSIVKLCRKHNMYIALVPLWSGCCAGDMAGYDREGNPLPMTANGVEKTYDFARWLGERYGHYEHVMWIIGGDNDPFNALKEYDALVRGLKETTIDQLFTYHAASTHSSTDVYPDDDWLDVSMIYTYFRGFNKAWNRIQPDVYEMARDEYMKRMMPFFLGESTYEGEHDSWGSELQVRKQAYWAAFSGATGHAYGSVNWRIPKNWREVLQYPGAQSLKHLPALLNRLSFESLEPDWDSELLITGAGQYASNDYAVAVFSKERKGAAVYIPSGREIEIDTKIFTSKIQSMSWYNPRSGDEMKIKPSVKLHTPDDSDWVLIINM